MKKTAEIATWSRRYRTALFTYIGRGPAARPPPPRGLGIQAAALGLETLDVARVHEQAMLTLKARVRTALISKELLEQTTDFFAATIGPIEETHRAARSTDRRVDRLVRTLRQRAGESSVTTRNLRRGIAQRRVAEKALLQSRKRRAALLQTARRLQDRLRVQTQAILEAQEDERLKTSRQLQEEIAQALLAVHVRLLTLKNAAEADTDRLKKEIVGTQRLVKDSVKTIRRMLRRLGGVNEE